MAVAILGGARPEAVPVERTTDSQPTVDWRALERFQLTGSDLPADTVVLHRPGSAWVAYRGRILAGLAVVLVQSGLIATLLVERRNRRRAELQTRQRGAELAHASRLAAVGEITASIAHQVNQPLAAIVANADAAELLLDARPVPLDDLRQILADIRRDDQRASEVVHGMRGLLSRREGPHRPLDLNAAVADILRLLDAEARRHRVVVDSHLAPNLPAVIGDRVYLQQVVLNLVLNGLEAAAAAPADRRRVAVRTTCAGTGEVLIVVADTGPGIPMGLGLSIARSLVEAHGGRIWAVNGGGAAFHVALPAATADGAAVAGFTLASSAEARPLDGARG
jgi:signal transduction histidine kinase